MQLSFFAAEHEPPEPADLAGLLAAGGQVVAMASGARVSIVVDAQWRAEAIAHMMAEAITGGDLTNGNNTESAATGSSISGGKITGSDITGGTATGNAPTGTDITGSTPTGTAPAATPTDAHAPAADARAGHATILTTDEGRPLVRTGPSRALTALAREWTKGAAKNVPAGWVPSARALRCWVLAAGRPADGHAGGYVLGVDPHGEHTHASLAAALADAGVAATLVGPRAGGPGLRITGRRRLTRLAQSVGEPPAGAPPGTWPQV